MDAFMTAQATPRRDSANLAANEASSSDSRSPSGTCPLMNAKVQLLPLRYGLTEGVDPSAELAMPFALKAGRWVCGWCAMAIST